MDTDLSRYSVFTNSSKYDDIINLPHYQSPTKPHMGMIDRAAQFSPFAALTGYESRLNEAARAHDETYAKEDTDTNDMFDC